MVMRDTVIIHHALGYPIEPCAMVRGNAVEAICTTDSSTYIFPKGEQIVLKQENPWKDGRLGSKALMFLLSLDLVFGNATEGNKLPVEISYEASGSAEICLDEIAVTDPHSIARWKRAARLQSILAMCIMILVSGLLLSIMPAPYSLFFGVLAFVGLAWFFIQANKRISRLTQALAKLIDTKK